MNYNGLVNEFGLRHERVRDVEARLRVHLSRSGRGRRLRGSARFLLLVTLMRLRTGMALRFIARLYRIDHVTLWRYCRDVTAFLAGRFDPTLAVGEMIVDSTSVWIASTAVRNYSGHKKRFVAKVQVLCDPYGKALAVSKAYAGGVHDKTIWNENVGCVPPGSTVLADKAYAGAVGEGTTLFRPAKRNENAWRNDPAGAKEANRALSKKRVRIEHLFARLKTWRIIGQRFPNRLNTLDDVFKAIAYIHNLSRHGDILM
jgi:hypothetical protein